MASTSSHNLITLTRPFKRDLYCWVCHMEGALLKCKTCPRIYHRNCANQLGTQTSQFLHLPSIFQHDEPSPHILKGCPECQMATRTAYPSMRNVPAQDFRRVCMSITRNLRDGYFWPNPFYKLEVDKDPKEFARYKDIVAKVMDVFELENLAFANHFKSLEALFAEVKWILHNTIVVHGRCSREADCAKDLLDMCQVEMMAADLCPECYLKEQSRETDAAWFTKPCFRQPHPLGWAKTPHNPYWPVKIMRWLPSEDIVTVWSFGEYRRFDVPLTKCVLYSKHPPQFDSHKGCRAADFRNANEEIQAHVAELEKVTSVNIPSQAKRLGAFHRMENAVQFMFPDLKIFEESVKIEAAVEADMANNNATDTDTDTDTATGHQ